MIYTDRLGSLNKLLADSNYEAIVKVYNESGRVIAGLFQKL